MCHCQSVLIHVSVTAVVSSTLRIDVARKKKKMNTREVRFDNAFMAFYGEHGT